MFQPFKAFMRMMRVSHIPNKQRIAGSESWSGTPVFVDPLPFAEPINVNPRQGREAFPYSIGDNNYPPGVTGPGLMPVKAANVHELRIAAKQWKPGLPQTVTYDVLSRQMYARRKLAMPTHTARYAAAITKNAERGT